MLEEIDKEYRDKRFPPRLLLDLSTCLTVVVIACVFAIAISLIGNMYVKYTLLIIGILVEVFLSGKLSPLFDIVVLGIFEVVNRLIPIDRKSKEYKLFAKTYLDTELDKGEISMNEYNSSLEELKERVV